MALQFSTSVRNALLDAIETAAGTGAVLGIFTGSQPANCAAANSGTELMRATLPSDWMGNAASGAKAKAGTWEDTSANATGTAGHWRLYASDGTTCHAQGSCTATGGGGDMEMVTTSVTTGQPVTITGFTLTAPGA